MPSRGGPARQITSHPGQDVRPSWSPDGREIAFVSLGRAATSIVGATGGEPRRLAAAGGEIAEWSPDGQWLVFQRENSLYRVARGGGEPTLLPPTRVRPNFPQFSRDGQSIYYHGATGPREAHDFWRLSFNDGKVSQLTKLEGRRGSIGNVFSTDDRYLYFTWREDEGDIWVMDVVPPLQ